ncbi:uncharacterized protein LOC135137250 isoform X2 [Zophobas morio]|uniref:uncharacterized protein LOC135137250 isoform X2 n=1 Tax=Zophobas morio TaxID=2755281 RepID=UPI0030836EC3
MVCEDWVNDGRSIGLLAYSTLITLTCATSLIFLVLLLKKRKRTRYARIKTESEDLQQLHRRSVDNQNETDPFSTEPSSPPLTPNNPRVVSEYDATLTRIPEIEDQAIFHEYEKMKPSKSENSQYHHIIQHVVTTLSVVYSSTMDEGDVYENFMKELLKKLKVQNPHLYKSVHGATHMYEEIKEEKQPTARSSQVSADDNDYAEYRPSKNRAKHVARKKTKIVFKNTNVLGSTDHLKYLKESECVENAEDDTYLEAKRFSPKIDCPEPIRKLCNGQGENKNHNEISGNSLVMQAEINGEDRTSSRTSRSTSTEYGVVLRSKSRRSEELDCSLQEVKLSISRAGYINPTE